MNKLQTINRNGLVGEWLLDGNALDTSGSGNNGTGTNVTYTSTDRGYQSQTGVFNGSSAYISTTSLGGMTNFSVSCWIYLTSDITGAGLSSVISSEQSVNTYGLTIHGSTYNGNNNDIGFYVNGAGGGNAFLGGSLSLNRWYHIVGVKTSTLHYLYVDNVLKSSFNSGAYTSVSQTQAIGVNSGLASRFFPGNIQSTRIYNRVLSTQEIDTLYKEGLRKLAGAGIAPLTDGLVAYYDFNGDANDIIGGNNGTVTGATLTTDRFGNANRAYSFNGTSDYISNSTAIWTPGVFTMSCWLKPTNTPTSEVYKYIMYATDGGTTGFTLLYANTSGTVQVIGGKEASGSAFSNARSNTTLTNGTWYHLCATSDGTTDTIYINGVNSGSASTLGSGGTTRTVGTYFGKRSDGQFSNDTVSDGMIIKKCLSASEVSSLYSLSSKRYITPLLH